MYSLINNLPTSPNGQRPTANDDLLFFEAWEKGLTPRSLDAGTMLRVRQIRRASKIAPPSGADCDRP
jgi:hypothetical protein